MKPPCLLLHLLTRAMAAQTTIGREKNFAPVE
jgi:hypothetical protein